MVGTVGIETLGPRTTMVADGLGWAEGSALMPDGSVCFVETYRSQVSNWRPDSGVARYSYTAGGPNACIVAADGALLVCQNGGTTGPWRAEDQITPGIQRVPPGGGRAETVLTEVDGNQLNGPNDLVFAPDGTLYFADPGTYRPEDPEPSRIYAVSPSGKSRLSWSWIHPHTPMASRSMLMESCTGQSPTRDWSRRSATVDGWRLWGDCQVTVRLQMASQSPPTVCSSETDSSC